LPGIARRTFLRQAALAAGAWVLGPERSLSRRLPPGDPRDRGEALSGHGGESVTFTTDDPAYRSLYQSALGVLEANTRQLPPCRDQVLIEGSVYQGIWLECAPQEGLVYAPISPRIARNNHLAFFRLQGEDGQIPCSIKSTGIGQGQIQMVIPIAATAFELAEQSGDSELLDLAYRGAARWDAWLSRYRDTRKTGLCEGFCTYDTGHDNSPRWNGIPNQCPDQDARKCPTIDSLPRLCPDLSATVYGGRMALARMAESLGKKEEAERWREEAATIRTAILNRLFNEHDAAFYDLDAHGSFVRVRGDATTRVLGEHVVDQGLFETIYRSQIHNPAAFWAPYPLPSIALDDSSFVRPIPRNSWGGATQALTALRAPRWMEHYGKPADLAYLMQQWISALLEARAFRQQMDPLTGLFTEADPSGYSPSALVFFDFTWRLRGVRSMGDRIEWNVRCSPAIEPSSFRLRLSPTRIADLKYASGEAEALLNGRSLFRTRSVVRLITDRDGVLREAVGVAGRESTIEVGLPGRPVLRFQMAPNGKRTLAAPS
jgi:hypothetical protein